ncbi:hypothetical protein Lqui_1341 [Legionella quinlivanii]|uniref:Uncharacterized protein n=1 Tax=Legionella quinlivanii TaxID=45073 RepID=A0A0W0XZX1_9GAMM|nr:hypothetical protein [Legionella quinlivanii]KTD50016.1 hypothetical protein Lqui_1341 [Legionella quinlivanii]SEF94579.1 hypothetical protein SAMN02746093_01456 [Legionella quinlivanii DSM 21216]STY11208.1 Uncharacterised protein [Legionella quinlivanii]
MKQSPEAPPSQSMGLSALNAIIDTHNIGSTIMLEKVEGVLPKTVFVKHIFIMSILKEVANNPTSNYSDALLKVSKELVTDFAVMLALGPVGLGVEIASYVGDRIDLEEYDQAVSSYLSATSPTDLPQPLKEELSLRQFLLVESGCLPYLCKGISVGKQKLSAGITSFVELCADKLSDCFNALNDTIIEPCASKLLEIVSLYGEPIQDDETSFKDLLLTTLKLMWMNQRMAEAVWFAQTVDASSKAEPPSPDDAIELFKEMVATASEKIIERYSNKEDLSLADETVAKTTANYRQLIDRFKPVETGERRAKTVLAEVLPDTIKIGAEIAEFVFRLHGLKQEDKQFDTKKSEIIRGFEEKIKGYGLILDESRKKEYLQNPNMPLPDLRHHVYSLMAEDITLELIGREKRFLAIQNQIHEINQHNKSLGGFKQSTGIVLQQVIAEQIRIQYKIKDLTANKIPAEIQAGVSILHKFAGNCYPAVTLALEGASYLTALHNMNAQNKVEKKLLAHQLRFEKYDSLASGLSHNLQQASYHTQHNLAAKTQLSFEQLGHAYGTPLLTRIRELTTEYQDDLNFAKTTVAELLSEKNQLEQDRNRKGTELFNASDKKRSRLIDDINQLNAHLSDNALSLLTAQKDVENIQTTLDNLDKLYEQQKPIAPMLDLFDEIHADFYKGYTKDEIEARVLWQKTVKEQLCKIDALKADIDNAMNGITTELLGMLPLLQGMGLNKTAGYFARGVNAIRNGYTIYRTGEKIAIAIRQLNRARFTSDGDTLLSTMSFVDAWKKMGTGFTIDKLITPLASLINFSARLLDSVFGWNLFKDPIQEMRRLLAAQIKEGVERVSEQLRQVSQQLGQGFGDVKREFIDIRLNHAENSNQHRVAQLTDESRHNENRILQLHKSQENLSRQVESSITKVITKISRVKFKPSHLLSRYSSFAAREALYDGANNITIEDGVIVDPLNAVQYIQRNLVKYDETLSQALLPNYYLICSILEESLALLQEGLSQNERASIPAILNLGINLYSFVEHLHTNTDWLCNLTNNIFADLEKAEQMIRQRQPYRELTTEDKEITRLNSQAVAWDLARENETTLGRLTRDYQNDELCYWPNYKKHNKAAAPQTIKSNAVVITELLKNNSIRVMLIANGKFVERQLYDDKNKFNINVPLSSEEVKLVNTKRREFGKYAQLPDEYKQLMDKIHAEEYGVITQYHRMLQMLFRSQLPSRSQTCFELSADALAPLLNKLSTKTHGHDLLAQTLGNIPVVLIQPHNKEHLPLLLPKALIDAADKHPNNEKLVEAARAGLIQIKIEYIFEKHEDSYLFSLLYSIKKDSTYKINNAMTTVYRFEYEDLKTNSSSPIEILITALYGGHLIAYEPAAVYKINLFAFSAKYPTLGFFHSSRLFSRPLANALRNMIEHGIVTQALKPFILEKHTHTKCDEWGLINLHLSTLRKERSLLLQNALEQDNGHNLSAILARASKNYELLIGAIRLFSTHDYPTTVEVVRKILHLPHLKKITVLLNTNIESLQYFLQKTMQNNKLRAEQKVGDLFEKVRTLMNDRNHYQHELGSLLNAIKAKLTSHSDPEIHSHTIKLDCQRIEIEKIINYREALKAKATRSHLSEKDLLPKENPELVNDISIARACDVYRAVARQLFIVNKKVFNKLTPCTEQSFFKNSHVLIETAQAILRMKVIELLRNNHEDLSREALDAYLNENHPGDDNTLMALATILELTIIVADNTESACYKLRAYSTQSMVETDFKKSILLLRNKEQIYAAGTHLSDDLIEALQTTKENLSTAFRYTGTTGKAPTQQFFSSYNLYHQNKAWESISQNALTASPHDMNRISL